MFKDLNNLYGDNTKILRINFQSLPDVYHVIDPLFAVRFYQDPLCDRFDVKYRNLQQNLVLESNQPLTGILQQPLNFI